MDAITAIVIGIFVISIFGAVNKTPNSIVEVDLPAAPPPYSSVEQPVAQTPDEEENDLQNAIYNFILKQGKNVRPNGAAMMAECIMKYSSQYQVDPKLVTGLIAAESRFNSQAVSRSGAQGLGQLLPSTARHLGVTDPFNIDQNIMGTTRYIKSMLDKFAGYNPISAYALAGYKEGPNNVLRRGGYKQDTQQYIDLIMKYYGKI